MLIDGDAGFYFGDFEKKNASRLSEDVILRRQPDHVKDATIMFFHEKFFNALNIKDHNIMPYVGLYIFDKEKYFYFFNWERYGMRLDINDAGLYNATFPWSAIKI